jgi:hypothetical protein
MRVTCKGLGRLLSAMALSMLPALAEAQPLTQAQKDSGWVALFDGSDFQGLYSYLWQKGTPDYDLDKTPDGNFSIQDGVIRVKGTLGYLATRKKYSHYRIRVRIKFDKAGDLGQNAGVLYHVIHENQGLWPSCIEFQGQKRGIGELWTIDKVYVNTTIDPKLGYRKYLPGGKMVTHGEPDGRQCEGSSVPYVDNQWNLMEAVVRGSDSATHTVNGVVTLKNWKIRWSANDDPADMSFPLKEGLIALQSEEAPLAYKDFMIMELDPATGKPLHGATVLAREWPSARPHRSPAWRGDPGGLYIDFAYGATAPGGARLLIRGLDGRALGAAAREGSGDFGRERLGAAGVRILRNEEGPAWPER